MTGGDAGAAIRGKVAGSRTSSEIDDEVVSGASASVGGPVPTACGLQCRLWFQC